MGAQPAGGGHVTAKTTKPGGETWRDWLPPGTPEPERMTRKQLLAKLRARGIPLEKRRLRDWEAKGILPRPDVRDAPPAGSRALYPAWHDEVITAVYRHWRRRARRLPPAELAPIARRAFALRLAGADHLAVYQGLSGDLTSALLRLAARQLEPMAAITLVVEDADGETLNRHRWHVAQTFADVAAWFHEQGLAVETEGG